ncbi:MAG: cation-transporting P-type ATPase [Candidatus Lambdaproteobacteria bacterium]|nr:cation-transporting P-type ATPase [Candidatus Lambdaproteobacteria bacterium]
MADQSTPTQPAAARAPAPRPWHALAEGLVSTELGVEHALGLEGAEAAARLARHGPNRLPEKPPRPLILLFVDQFKSLLILILAVAAVFAAAVGDLKDAIVIMVVTLLNALLGFYQEHRAEQSLEALKKMLPLRARVRREGRTAEVAAETLVPGDIVLLEPGDRVAADGRLVLSQTLEIDESSLTGESRPAEKDAKALAAEPAPLAERANMAYMNTMVTRGRGELMVTATGHHTEMGRIAQALAETTEPPTPLQVQIDHLGKRLAAVAGIFIAMILALGLYTGKGLFDAVLEAIALAVAAVPEGLPAVVTVTLALGMRRMARNRAIVKRLAAVETLGSTTVICSDKTGTLTLNQMTARAFFHGGRRFKVTGEGYLPEGEILIDAGVRGLGRAGELPDLGPMLRPIVLCNDSNVRRGGVLLGDPTEGALVVLAAKGGITRRALERTMPRVAEIPFDSAHNLMATFHPDGEGESVYVAVKGAPEALLRRCSHWLTTQGRQPFDGAAREALLAENAHLAGQQLRVLAVASRRLPADGFDPAADLWPHVQGLTLLGLVGMIDPARPEAAEAIRLCRQAGIQVKMITGDQKITAMAIALHLGLPGQVLTGEELQAMDTAQLAGVIDQVAVFARVAPAHKVRIVEALKARGHVVAMTGDGVNDAPALKSAHIGVAMGKGGTEVAKEASSMVLTDDNFATIVGAVGEGRAIYDNIVKFVKFQLSTNIGALFSMLTAYVIPGLPSPLNPVQILWINIIMDGPPAMAMGLEPLRPENMQERPRPPEERILSWRRLAMLFGFGAMMVAGTVGVLYGGLHSSSAAAALGGVWVIGPLLAAAAQHLHAETAPTLAFTTFVLFQIFNAFNARVDRYSAFSRGFLSNGPLWGSLAGVVLLQVAAVETGFGHQVFNTHSLSVWEWLIATVLAASILIYGEALRLLGRYLRHRRAAAQPHTAVSTAV